MTKNKHSGRKTAQRSSACRPPSRQRLQKKLKIARASKQNEVMGYRTLRDCVLRPEATGQLIYVEEPVDPNLEMAEIQRRLFRAGGPAVLFTNPNGCRFPMLANLFGTMERMRYLFRDTLEPVRRLGRPCRSIRPICCGGRGCI